jgi:hypothetical protein
VFSHHAVGNFRGGAEIASLYEWGGYDRSGAYLFDKMRPGWGEPIQKIMEDTGVTIFFQGHDHLFAREAVNGVVYQTLPKPAETTADKQSNPDAYPDADVLANSGYLNVTVKLRRRAGRLCPQLRYAGCAGRRTPPPASYTATR